MLELRGYQAEAVAAIHDDLRVHKRALLSLATGLGKTACAMQVMRDCGSALFVTNKIDLAVQSLDRWKQYFGDDGDVGLCVGSKGRREIKPFTFATVQTASKLDMSGFNLVVIDESHVELLDGEGYYRKLLDAIGSTPVLGLTATPFRNGKGYIYGKGKFYPRISYGKDIKWGVENGFLVEPKLKAGGGHEFDTSKVGIKLGDFDIGRLGELADDEDKVTEQVRDALKRIEDRKCVLWSCVNIEHAEMVANKIQLEGKSSIAYHSKTEDRANVMDAIHDGKYQNISFVSAIAEGFDLACADALIMMRPTRSPGLAIQMIGRVLRPFADKGGIVKILDYGQVIKNIGPIDKPVIRETSKRDKKQDALVAAQLKTCPGCLSYVPSATRECPDCGHDFFVDVLKNVNKRPDFESKLFSTEGARIRWESVGDVSADYNQSANGNWMIAVHFKKTIFDGPWGGYKDHIVMQSWNRDKGITKVAAYAGPAFTDWSFERPELCVRAINNSDVCAILVDETGKWPRVLRVRKADGREIFVG